MVPVGSTRHPRSVDVGARRRDRSPPSVAVGLEEKGLELDAHQRNQTALAPCLDDVAQDVAWRQRHGLTFPDYVGDHNRCAFLPTGPDVVFGEDCVAVGEALPEQAPIVRDHLPIETEGEQGDAVGGPGGSLLRCEVLATGEAEMVGPKEAQTVEIR